MAHAVTRTVAIGLLLSLAGTFSFSIDAPAAASGTPASSAAEVPVTTLARGSDSGIRTPTNAVIRSAGEWRALWGRHRRGSSGGRPFVDFSREMVIAVFAGEAPAGARMGIQAIRREEARILVLVHVVGSPGPEPLETRPITPYHIVRTARFPLPVVFVQSKLPQLFGPGPGP